MQHTCTKKRPKRVRAGGQAQGWDSSRVHEEQFCVSFIVTKQLFTSSHFSKREVVQNVKCEMWVFQTSWKTLGGSSWFSSDITKIQTPKLQGLLRFYLHVAKYLLKINFCESFQRDSVFRFENIALSSFPSLLRVTLIWRPRRLSHTVF